MDGFKRDLFYTFRNKGHKRRVSIITARVRAYLSTRRGRGSHLRGVPPPCLGWGYSHPHLGWGTTALPRPGMGYPCPPPVMKIHMYLTWHGGTLTPHLWWGNPTPCLGYGFPCLPHLGWGTRTPTWDRGTPTTWDGCTRLRWAYLRPPPGML